MSNIRMARIVRKPRTTLLFVLGGLALYLLAFGPAIWLFSRDPPRWVVVIVATVYEPLDLLAHRSQTADRWMGAYATLWMPAEGSRLTGSPTDSLRWMQVLTGAVIGCWMIWNVVGWFTRDERRPLPDG
jgi:hypothetical protein